MNITKCNNGYLLLHDVEAEAYWLVTEICGKASRLFAGTEREGAEEFFKKYFCE